MRMLILVDGWYLPPLKEMTLPFLQQLLSGEKDHLLTVDLRPMIWPRYREFTMVKFYENVGEDTKVLKFLPDRKLLSRPLNRSYAYNILSTTKPDFS